MKRSGRIFALVVLLGGCAIAVDAGKFLRADVALIRYNEDVFQSRWIEDVAFSGVLQRDYQEHQRIFLTGPKNVFVSDDLKHGVRKKGILLAFSPRVFIRPVIIIEELQALFITYQSQETAFVEGNAPAETMTLFGGMAHVQQVVTSPRIFSFILYYHKVYGVYVQIIW